MEREEQEAQSKASGKFRKAFLKRKHKNTAVRSYFNEASVDEIEEIDARELDEIESRENLKIARKRPKLNSDQLLSMYDED